MDTLSPEQRSANMRAIKGRDTRPERIVRSLLHKRGYRFRIGGKGVVGRPDIVFTARKKAIFVHGCFWHRHEDCSKAYSPKSRVEFWEGKFQRNRERDRIVSEGLKAAGWSVLVVWECETPTGETLEQTLIKFLGPPALRS